MRYLITAALALAFCLPAQADILILRTKTGGRQFDSGEEILLKKKEYGYLVIDGDLADPYNVTLNEVYHLHYEKTAEGKTQYTTILDTDEVELIMIDYGAKKKMVLRYFDDVAGTYQVVFGNAASKDIGGIQRYVAGGLKGQVVWKLQDFITGSGNVRLKLDIKATKQANEENKTAFQVINEYEQMLEQTKGYTTEF